MWFSLIFGYLLSRGQGHLLTFNGLTDLLIFASVDRKSIYHICSKSLFFKHLVSRPDTKWRQHGQVPPNLSPTWWLLYKPPISKRVGDMQWRVLHLAIPTNHFVSRFNLDVMPTCPFCPAPETVFHFFTECSRLLPLFSLLQTLLRELGFLFNQNLLVFSVRYSKERKGKFTLANFLLGQAKLAIYKTHKTEKEEGKGKDLVGVFKVMVRTRVAADFAYYKMTDEFLCFNQRGCIDGVICLVDSTDGISFQF